MEGGKMKKLRLLPIIVMLIAGLITCIISFLKQYDNTYALTTLFVVLVIFYMLGLIARTVIIKVCFSEKEESELEENEENDEITISDEGNEQQE
jgi:uncharacterized membrane protein YqjE